MYLQIERGLSKNSIDNYTLDIQAFQKFLEQKKIKISPLECDEEILKKFIYETAKVLSPYTQSRRVAGLRSFFDYLIFFVIFVDFFLDKKCFQFEHAYFLKKTNLFSSFFFQGKYKEVNLIYSLYLTILNPF